MTSSFDTTAAAAAAATAVSATAVAADPSAVPVLTTAATSATTASPPATTPDYHYSPSNTEPDSDNYDDYASEHSSDDDSSDDYDQDEYDENGQLIEYLSDAQAEWEESIAQIQRLLTCILIPVVGKFFGRRFSYFRKFFSFLIKKKKRTFYLKDILMSGFVGPFLLNKRGSGFFESEGNPYYRYSIFLLFYLLTIHFFFFLFFHLILVWGKYVNYKYGAKVLITDKPAFDATTAMHSAVVI